MNQSTAGIMLIQNILSYVWVDRKGAEFIGNIDWNRYRLRDEQAEKEQNNVRCLVFCQNEM